MRVPVSILCRRELEREATDKVALTDIVRKSQLLKQERKIRSANLALVLVHDLLLAGGIQAGDGPIKQAIMRHKTRLSAEFAKLKVKQNATSNLDLAQQGDVRACESFLCSARTWLHDTGDLSSDTSLRSCQYEILDQ